tara:strand:+ start:753 stop:1508 length:756 start_codon:yes stop_codon:yes gene_type:complete
VSETRISDEGVTVHISKHNPHEVKPRQRSAIALVSGGLDSLLILELGRRYGWQLIALVIDYGQRNTEEPETVYSIAQHYEIAFVRMTVSGMADSLISLPKNAANENLPIRTLDEIRNQERSEFYHPARNTMFLALALSLAEKHQFQRIIYGATLEDFGGFADCRPRFADAFSRVASLSAGYTITVSSPLWQMRKVDVVRTLSELNAPMHMTVSCYAPVGDDRRTHCGRCPACLLRSEAFENAGVTDPTRYA